jgi:hypothetical protein
VPLPERAPLSASPFGVIEVAPAPVAAPVDEPAPLPPEIAPVIDWPPPDSAPRTSILRLRS